MKRISILTFIAAFSLLSCNSEGGLFVFFQNSDSEPTFEQQNYLFPQTVSLTKQNQNFLQDSIYPIGWSYAGAFAYLNHVADEACGCTYLCLYILDANTNQTEIIFEYNDFGEGLTVHNIWNQKYETIEKVLHEKKIKQFHQFKIHSPKFASGNIHYEIKLNVTRIQEPDYTIEFVKKTEIDIESRKNGAKQVALIDYKSPYFVLDASVIGVFISPFKKHIAILYKEEKKGYEGPPHTIGFIPMGTNIFDNF